MKCKKQTWGKQCSRNSTAERSALKCASAPRPCVWPTRGIDHAFGVCGGGSNDVGAAASCQAGRCAAAAAAASHCVHCQAARRGFLHRHHHTPAPSTHTQKHAVKSTHSNEGLRAAKKCKMCLGFLHYATEGIFILCHFCFKLPSVISVYRKKKTIIKELKTLRTLLGGFPTI